MYPKSGDRTMDSRPMERSSDSRPMERSMDNRSSSYGSRFPPRSNGFSTSSARPQRSDFSNGGFNNGGGFRSNGFGGGDRFKSGGGMMNRQSANQKRDNLMAESDTEVGPENANFTTIKNFLDTSKPPKYSQDEIRRYYDEEKIISAAGSNPPEPFLSFDDYAWPKLTYNLFRRNNYEKPTPIQAQCWPIALSGKDLIGIAVTGSGKTMAYTLPAFIHIEGNYQRRGNGPMAVILAPTRELAQQIDEVVNQFSYISSACVYGGAPRGPQIHKIQRERPDIIIATPGRLIDFLKEGIFNLHNVSYLVLDEADRMLDMGFEPQIRKIVKRIPARDRQTLMFSATWPKEVRRLAEDFLTNPVHIKIGSMELQANQNITQIIDVCKQGDKVDKLFELLEKIMSNKENKTIIFADMKKKVDYLQKMLKVQRYQVAAIHGDKTQSQRDFILQGFKQDRFRILIATDVASRGLDVEDIKYVINFDYPNSSEDYVHRIGRTGRRDNKGVAYTFFTDEDEKQAGDLVKVLQQAKQDVHPQLLSMTQKHGGGSYGNRFRQYGSFAGKRKPDFGGNDAAKRVKRFDSNGNSSYGPRPFANSNSRY